MHISGGPDNSPLSLHWHSLEGRRRIVGGIERDGVTGNLVGDIAARRQTIAFDCLEFCCNTDGRDKEWNRVEGRGGGAEC